MSIYDEAESVFESAVQSLSGKYKPVAGAKMKISEFCSRLDEYTLCREEEESETLTDVLFDGATACMVFEIWCDEIIIRETGSPLYGAVLLADEVRFGKKRDKLCVQFVVNVFEEIK